MIDPYDDYRTRLCKLIAEETDPDRLLALVRQLNDELERSRKGAACEDIVENAGEGIKIVIDTDFRRE